MNLNEPIRGEQLSNNSSWDGLVTWNVLWRQSKQSC